MGREDGDRDGEWEWGKFYKFAMRYGVVNNIRFESMCLLCVLGFVLMFQLLHHLFGNFNVFL